MPRPPVTDDRRRTLTWLVSIAAVLTLLVLFFSLMTLVVAWPPQFIVFFLGIWIVVAVRTAWALKSR